MRLKPHSKCNFFKAHREKLNMHLYHRATKKLALFVNKIIAINSLNMISIGLFPLLLVSGCVSIPLSEENRTKIQTLSIQKDVEIKRGIVMKYMTVPMDQLTDETMRKLDDNYWKYPEPYNPAVMLEHIIEVENIDVGKILHEHFLNELKRANVFRTIVTDDADAEFQIIINQRTFASLGTGKFKPLMGVEATLINSDGIIVWRKLAGISHISKVTPSHTLVEYINNPEYIRKAFSIASQIVAEILVNDMLPK